MFAAAERLTDVVNNAGATYRYASLAQTSPGEIRRTIEINLTAAVLVARAAVRKLSTSYGGAGGVIVNVSSGAATIGSPGEYVHYAAAKAGVDTLTRGLGLEVADQGIRVVGVAPGLIDTDLHARTGDPDRIARMAPDIPLGRAGRTTEVAEAVAWLMSDAAAYITATTLRSPGDAELVSRFCSVTAESKSSRLRHVTGSATEQQRRAAGPGPRGRSDSR